MEAPFLTISTFPVAAIVLSINSIPLHPSIEAQIHWLSRASRYANSAIEAFDTVKAYNDSQQEIWKYISTIKKAASNYNIQARCNAMHFEIKKLLMVAIFVQGFWFGLHWWIMA